MRQSVLDAAGPHAARIESLWWVALTIATVVYLATIGALVWATWQARSRRTELAPGAGDRRMTFAVSLAIGATIVILLTFFVYDLSVGRAIRTPRDGGHLLVKLTGYQWWWKVEYPDSIASNWVTDANEIHIPTGQAVLIELTSNDVIHSLWVPNLAGKKDLIPRYKDTLWFQADSPGVYRGQCAEFCGHQHAQMGLDVIAHAPGDFQQWLARSRVAAPPPADTLTRRGQEIFLAGPCVLCHAIQGTRATSHAGPDLTHLASRRRIAAGTLPNTRGNLAAWILDPQRVKPGANMPSNALSPSDLEALLAYLQTLK